MIAKYWQQRDLSAYDFHDLIDINSVIWVQEENRRRAEAAQREAERNRTRK